MNLFAGLEKFGFQKTEDVDLFAGKKESVKEEPEKAEIETEEKAVEIPPEEQFLLNKSIRCVVCDRTFSTKAVKAGRVRRMEPDMDLRPRHQYVDTLKYGVSSCPQCGYTSLNRYFEHITSGQIRLIREQVCSSFEAGSLDLPVTYDYDQAIDMHKLALLNAVVKRARNSEKAYNCLILSWLLRTKIEQLEQEHPEQTEQIAACKEEEETFYQQAYDGMLAAVSSEMFPICGMDQVTMDYLLAVMSYHFKKYDVASKTLANVITSSVASRKMKDKALELKDEIIKELKKKK